MIKTTRKIKIKNTFIGGDAPISVQSMCNTKTEDVAATVAQILRLEELGCDIVRVTVNNERAAEAIKSIVGEIHIPLVADIHYDAKLAKLAAENGADKIRINPGNIGSEDKVKYLAEFLNERNIPIRIGVNEGSLEKGLKGLNRVEALVKSAENSIAILEKADFYNTVVSIKSSDVATTVAACEAFAERFDYPQHIGVTEAGTLKRGLIKNSIGIGALLLKGIGNTIRVSLSTKPEEEVVAGNMLLTSLGLKKGAEVIACPTCGRTEISVSALADEIEGALRGGDNMKIAVMGCVVNGVGEAGNADFGVAGGRDRSAIFENGEIIKYVENQDILLEIKALIEKHRTAK